MDTQINKKEITAKGIRFTAILGDKKVGRSYLYLMHNDLHQRPFALVEDVFVDEQCRGQGVGSKLVKEMIKEAKNRDCYKIIMTSRYSKPRVHSLYLKLGFEDWGKEFRMEM
ncbi:MAG: GNAT family N-acetyltransferase [Patescibacteria group bacterium]